MERQSHPSLTPYLFLFFFAVVPSPFFPVPGGLPRFLTGGGLGGVGGEWREDSDGVEVGKGGEGVRS